ncbi:hypothetical protein ACRAWD_04820 [Caulobacter segnis]
MTGDFAGAAQTFETVGEPLGDGAVLDLGPRGRLHAAVETMTAEAALALYGRIAGPLAEDPATVLGEGFSILVAFKRLAAARKLGDWLARNTLRQPGPGARAPRADRAGHRSRALRPMSRRCSTTSPTASTGSWSTTSAMTPPPGWRRWFAARGSGFRASWTWAAARALAAAAPAPLRGPADRRRPVERHVGPGRRARRLRRPGPGRGGDVPAQRPKRAST